MLTHKGTQTIATPRLVLRRFSPEDAEAMFQNWANDPRVTRYLTWQPHGSPELTRALLSDWCAHYENADCYNWAITLDGIPVGNISAVRIDERIDGIEVGYCLGHGHWGRGIMTEATRAVIRFFFEEVGANRIEVSHATSNTASGRVAEKCGLTAEGIKREFYFTPAGEALDIKFHSILKREYFSAGAF